MRKKFFIIAGYCFLAFLLFYPVLIEGKTSFQSNLLVSFFAPWNTERLSGVPFKPMGIDNLNLFYPYSHLVTLLEKAGMLPLWNPYNFSGNVLAANLQSAVYYPLHFVYLFLPQLAAWDFLVIVQPIMAAVFTWMLLRFFKLSQKASFLGGMVFGFSGEMLVWMGDHLVVSHTFLWLPLILLGLETYLSFGSRGGFLLSIIGLAASFFAGFFQPFFYVAVVSLAYYGFRSRTLHVSSRRLLIGLLIFLISLGIVSIQLFPTFEVFLYSARKTVDAGYLSDIYLMPLTHLISLIAPDYMGNPATYSFFGLGGYHESVLFIGVLPLFFAIYSLFQWKKDARIRFFVSAAVISLVLGLKLPLMKQIYTFGIPLVSTFLPSRVFFLTTFLLSVLCAFGFDEWRRVGRMKFAIWFFAAVLIFLGIGLAYGHFLYMLPLGISRGINQYIFRVAELTPVNVSKLQKGLILPAAFAFVTGMIVWVFRNRRSVTAFTLCVFLASAIPLLLFGKKYISFNDPKYLYPIHSVFSYLKARAGLDRFWTYGDGYIFANFATQYAVYSPDGTDALFPRWLGELYEASRTGGTFPTTIPRIDARITPAKEGEDLGKNTDRLRLLALAGVRYITDWVPGGETDAQAQSKFPPRLFTLVWKDDDWKIYEYTNVLPRVFLTDHFTVIGDPQRQFDAIFENVNPYNIVLDRKPPLRVTPSDQSGKVTITSYEPNRIHFAVNTTVPTLLYISDTYFPGWRAYVDSRETPILKANHAFRAVAVPSGANVVEMRYEPKSFLWGAMASVFALVVCIVAAVILPEAKTLRRG